MCVGGIMNMSRRLVGWRHEYILTAWLVGIGEEWYVGRWHREYVLTAWRVGLGEKSRGSVGRWHREYVLTTWMVALHICLDSLAGGFR